MLQGGDFTRGNVGALLIFVLAIFSPVYATVLLEASGHSLSARLLTVAWLKCRVRAASLSTERSSPMKTSCVNTIGLICFQWQTRDLTRASNLISFQIFSPKLPLSELKVLKMASV